MKEGNNTRVITQVKTINDNGSGGEVKLKV